MKKVIPIWKPVGFTPLQVVRLFQSKNLIYGGKKISYAGRLDPMAEGILLLLVDQENKNRKLYEDLEKIYESEIVLGIASDSFDVLGVVSSAGLSSVSKENIKKVLVSLKGKRVQIYPPYSSKTVGGKPLYWWARQKKLDEIDLPTREIEIYSVSLLKVSSISVKDLFQMVEGRIKKLKGDFRQDEVLNSWRFFLEKNNTKKVTRIKIRVSCSSGTYIRRLANDIGEKLGCGAITFSITRLGVGPYLKKDCVNI